MQQRATTCAARTASISNPSRDGAGGLTTLAVAAFIESETSSRSVPSCPELRLQTASSMAGIWERAQDCLGPIAYRPPYWALPWVGGQALARYLLDCPATVAGRSILDFGAGSGLCGIAAARAGAAVCASDVDPIARVAISLNADLNGVRIVITEDDLIDGPALNYDLILAADLWYEKALAERANRWLRQAVKAGTEVLLGDRGRAFFPRTGITLLAEYAIPSSPEVEQGSMTTAGVWRLAA